MRPSVRRLSGLASARRARLEPLEARHLLSAANELWPWVDPAPLAREAVEAAEYSTAAPEVVDPIDDVFVVQNAPNTVIDLSTVFSDSDPGDTLTYLVTTPTTVPAIVDQVSQANYTHIHQDLLYTHTGDNRYLLPQGVDHDAARDNIEAYFENLGLTTTLEPFTYTSTTYYNVVGTKLGATRPNDVYIVGAHYDSVNCPGADDNASGTAAVMEAARVLSNYQFDATLRFIAFDREEQGLKGSYAYVAAHSSDHILGMVNLDMIAYNPAGTYHDTVSLYDRIAGGSMKSNLAAAITTYAPGITALDSGQIWGSDHSPFEEAGFDAALIIEYNHNNIYYHQPTDAVETPNYIDYTYATKITRAATGYLADAAGLRGTTTLLSAEVDGSLLTLNYAPGMSGSIEVAVRAVDTTGLWVEDTFAVTVAGTASLDVDGNGAADALSDGILILRYLFDPAGPWTIDDALASGATRTTRAGIKSFLDDAGAMLDADGNGLADPLSDGILILRYLFEPSGSWTVGDALGAGATRTTATDVKAWLDQYNPGLPAGAEAIDTGWIDGDGPSALKNLLPLLSEQAALDAAEAALAPGSGVFRIYVEDGLRASIQAALDRYVADLVVDGYQPTVVDFSGTAAQLRADLATQWSKHGLEGALFVGDLPYVNFTSEDNFYATPSVATYPHDLYFMDLDGTYVLNDTGLDEHTAGSGDVGPEIYVSRITTGNLAGVTGRDEATLINQYFAKNHAYRCGDLKFDNRGIVFADDDWSGWGASQMTGLYSEVLAVNDLAATTRDAYLDLLGRDYESILECIHSGTTSHSVSGSGGGSVTNAQIAELNPRQAFYNMFNCSSAKFTVANNLIGTYVYSGDYGLNAVGSAKTGSMLGFPYFYQPQGAGESVGEAFRIWFDRYAYGTDDPYHDSSVDWHYGMTMQGDPTLKPALMPYGASVEPSGEMITGEGGRTATFTLVMDSPLTSDVTIPLWSSDPGEGGVWPASATFTPANWSQAQTVTVTGVDDAERDGAVWYTIVTGPATSADPRFDGTNPADVTVVNQDDEYASPTDLTLTPASLAEGFAAGTTVGTFATTDPDAGDSFYYELVAGTGDADNGSFTIEGAELKTNTVFDYETKSSYTIRVRSTDLGGLYWEESLTINVVNRAPQMESTLSAGYLGAGVSTLAVEFSEPVVGAGSAGAYELRRAGADGLLGTADDQVLPLGASYAGTSATLSFAALAEDLYRLAVRDTITDGAGAGLDGDDDGAAGGDCVLDFTVTSLETLDPGFGAGGTLSAAPGASHDVARSVLVQPDGKLVTAGYSNTGSVSAFALARYNGDGSPDAGFGADGRVTTKFVNTFSYAYGAALQSDGRIVVAGASGADQAVARYNSDGSLDTTFDSDGMVTTAVGSQYDYGRAVAIQSDGRIVVAGYAYNGSNNDFALTRYNADGSLDTTFDGDGKLLTDFGANDNAYGVAIQADGRIVVAGYANNGENTDFALACYNVDGSLDTTFGAGGKVLTPFGTWYEYGYSLAIQDDGKIVVAGQAYVGGSYDFALARYGPDGSLDEGFGTNGLVTTAIGGGSDAAWGVALRAGGKIVAVGMVRNGSYDDHAVACYNADGSLDTSFDGDGWLSAAASATHDALHGVAVDGDGRIVAAGLACQGDDSDCLLVRYAASGTPDASLAGDGLLTGAFLGGDDYGCGLSAQPDGKILLAGYSFSGSSYDVSLSRYLADGTLDAGFGAGGRVRTEISGADFGYAVAVQTDGKIVAAGLAGSDFGLVRYNADGSLDTTFSGDGKVATPIGTSSDAAHAVAIQADNKIVAAGYAYIGGNNDFAVARYNADGSLDTSFNGSGKVTTDFAGANDIGRAVALQSDGKIVVAGAASNGSNNDFALARYNANGSLDTSFGAGGRVVTPIGTSVDYVYGLAIQDDGRIVAGGYARIGSTDDFALVRYNPDGSLDASFGAGGIVITPIGSGNDQAYGVAIQPGGRIVLVGAAASGSNNDFAVVAYRPDGTLDESFGLGGKVTLDMGSPSDSARAVASLADGRIVAAGWTHNGTDYDMALACYQYAPVVELASLGQVTFGVDAEGAGAGQLLLGAGALEGLGRLAVDGADYSAGSTTCALADDGRTVVTPVRVMSGLNVHREVTVSPTAAESFARTLDVFENPGAAPVTVVVRLVGNLGSDAATSVFASSDGDTLVETTDRWFATDGGGTPAVVHCLRGPGGLRPTAVALVGDNVQWTYELTVPAGQTVRLAWLTIVADTRAAALAAAEGLLPGAGLSGEAAAFLAPEELEGIANFALLAPSLDVDGNGAADALTDGLLILRYLFDPAGQWRLDDALGAGATRTTVEDIRDFLDAQRSTVLDADGDGASLPLTDGILILRYLFAPEGTWAVDDALGDGATRTTCAEIESYLAQHDPAALDAVFAGW